MNQEQYNDIVAAINFGMPAKATSLISALNNVINLIQPVNKPAEVEETANEVKETE